MMRINRAFVEHYRCQDQAADFGPLGETAGAPGYFRFGADAICYGQVSVGFTADDVRAELNDALTQVQVEDDRCLIPFEPTEIVENLRRERYIADVANATGKNPRDGFIRKAYYAARPLLPVGVRKHLQRIALKGWDKKPFPCWPIDRSVDKIFERLMMLALDSRGIDRIPFIWFWPEGKSACAIMTHDVETRTGLEFCPSLMDLNDSYGIKSSFQIVPEGRYRIDPQVLNDIRRRGFEVNVHDWNHDGCLFSDREVFLTRAAKINQAAAEFEAQGFRSGVLYRNTDWFDAFTFSYDMSVPNVGHLDPQPGGCCTVMPYFIGRILEVPVTLTQDYALFHILRDYSIDLWTRQISLILGGNGLISSIVHPDYIIEKRARATYSRLLASLSALAKEENVWLALPREADRWWRERSRMTLVQKHGRWEIEGPGKERARIAYANSNGQRLTYIVE